VAARIDWLKHTSKQTAKDRMRIVTLTFTNPITSRVHNLRVNVDEVEYVLFTNNNKQIKLKRRGESESFTFCLCDFTFDFDKHKDILREAVEKSTDQWDYDTMMTWSIGHKNKTMYIAPIHTDDILDDQPIDGGKKVLLSLAG
jgi:hypothetical protein